MGENTVTKQQARTIEQADHDYEKVAERIKADHIGEHYFAILARYAVEALAANAAALGVR